MKVTGVTIFQHGMSMSFPEVNADAYGWPWH